MLTRNFERCGARARSRGGLPCQAPPVLDPETGLPRNGRCKLHGGRSTGPRTAEGRQRIAEAQRRRRDRQAVAPMRRVPSAGLPRMVSTNPARYLD
jgi:hypothetical protein